MARSIDELARLVEYHQDRYYNDQPEISDAEFDELWDELQRRAPHHPIFSRVGTDEATGFPKRRHLMPMNSQEKASTPTQLQKWAQRVEHEQYIVQYKLDGASIELQYRDGDFEYGVTRGDGTVGDDITANVRRMQGVVQKLPNHFTGAIRGEVIMEHEIHRRYYADKANCRNAANGLMKRKDGHGSEHLKVLCYDAHADGDTRPFDDELSKLKWIEAQGFLLVPYETFRTVEEIVHFRDVVAEERAHLEFDIDGLVVKGPTIDWADMRRARPQKQIAFKFSAEEALSVLREVEWSTSGHLYTPVAIIDPVKLAGTTVRRASLVHPELIADMNLRIGSEVVVTKRGDIIPKIERLVRQLPDATPIEVPRTCETCGTELVNEGKRLYCPNLTCPKRDFHRLQKWISVLEVRDFGDVLLKKLFDAGYVRRIVDLYRLRWEDIASFEGMGETSAKKALSNLHAVQSIPLARFVAGFDIFGIAALKIQKVVDAGFSTLEALHEASASELAQAEGIAEITAEQIARGVREVYPMMKEVLEATGIVLEEGTSSSSSVEQLPLEGETYCFTGTLQSMTRSEAERMVTRNGGQTRSSVTSSVDYVVTNDPGSGSSKLKKAAELKIPILSEKEFLGRLPEKK
ncbi:MAG: NAD-dependent DNA ligase LigA [Alkalispirochaeta sp.]